MKRVFSLILASLLLLCSCTPAENIDTDPVVQYEIDNEIVGKWIDTLTEQIIEYTDDGFYYEYINESFNSVKTRYITENGKIYYYLDGDEPDMSVGIEYEKKGDRLIVAGVLEYKPMDLKTSIEEME